MMKGKRMLIVGVDSSLGSELLERCVGEGIFITGIARDIISQGKAAIEKAIEALIKPDPDYVVNVWGLNHLSHIGETPTEDEAILTQNVMTPYWVINALVASRIRPCRVLNIASQTYRVPQRCTAIYCASKAAVVMLTKVMARELAPTGWVINALAPGKIEDTAMSTLTDEQVCRLRGWTTGKANEYALSNVPAGRFTNKEEVVDAIFATLQLPEYINGTCIDMTGGV